MESAFWMSTAAVTIAEIGDKTQLLSILLVTRFQRPWIIVAGILVATLLNHWLAALLGVWVRDLFQAAWFTWVLSGVFILAGIWALFPDKLAEDQKTIATGSIFLTTTLVFFLAEIGDKTQVVTSALAAQYHTVFLVMMGSTLGMLIANVPAVFLGQWILRWLPLAWIRAIAAALFISMGIWIAITGVLPQ